MNDLKKGAFQLILLLGVISLLGDIIYEGGRGVHGQYLNILGVNAARVGFIFGLGELLGYFFRLFSGYFAERTKSYWFFTIFGYGLLLSVPLISLSKNWQIVAFLIILERIGKGIRTPARDTIASYAAKRIGTGYGFGIAELLDQIGAVIGPFFLVLAFACLGKNQNIIGAYQQGYSFFWLPFVLLLFVLFFTYFKFKKSEGLELPIEKEGKNSSLSKHFWWYVLFVFLTTTGFANFAIVGFHLKNFGIFSDTHIPALYATAMGIDAIGGFLAGKRYDRLKAREQGTRGEYFLLLSIPLVAALTPFFVFSHQRVLIILGIIFLGLGTGIQETVMKAVVADMTPVSKRSGGYGIFSFSSGFAFFAGSAIAGYLYDYSIFLLIVFLATIEILSIPVFYSMIKTYKE